MLTGEGVKGCRLSNQERDGGTGDGDGGRGRGRRLDGQEGNSYNVKNPKKLRGKFLEKKIFKKKINFILGGTWL